MANDSQGNPRESAANSDFLAPPQRDQSGRFKKGSSGNRRGRPPKVEKPLTERGIQREMIAEFDRTVQVGSEKLSVFQVLVRKLLELAIKRDDIRAIKQLLEMYRHTVNFTAASNPEESTYLERLEKLLKEADQHTLPHDTIQMLNEARRKAKKL